jgi:5-methylcytosine-specific restriction protein A
MSPMAARRACLEPGCLGYADAHGRCTIHAAPIIARLAERRRLEPGRRWYYTARWARLRAAILRAEPLCRRCTAENRVTAATDVDHIDRHRGRAAAFWLPDNLQPLCRSCHAEKTAEERSAGG